MKINPNKSGIPDKQMSRKDVIIALGLIKKSLDRIDPCDSEGILRKLYEEALDCAIKELGRQWESGGRIPVGGADEKGKKGQSNHDIYIDLEDIDFSKDQFFQEFSQLRKRAQLGILKKEYGKLAIPVLLYRRLQWLLESLWKVLR